MPETCGAGDRTFRRSSVRCSARAGALGGADLDPDRTQSRRPRWATSRPISAASWPSRKILGRQPATVFPTFLALNSPGGVGNQGYLSATYAPFKVIPANANGITYTTNPDGQTRFNNRYKRDGLTRRQPAREFALRRSRWTITTISTSAANGMMYNPVVTSAFSFAAADSVRYGSSNTGNAMLVASQVLKANQGTRFIQITSNDGWDMHQNIYAATNLPAKGKLLDTALSSLIADLKASGLFEQHADRDGGRVRPHRGPAHRGRGPRSPGRSSSPSSPAAASRAARWWARPTPLAPTPRSTAGRRTATCTPRTSRPPFTPPSESTGPRVRHDDPLGRGFEYVPTTGPVPYLPVNELWG
jgi:hypothetical protein